MTLPLLTQARNDLALVGWRLNVLLALANDLLDVLEYRRVKSETVACLVGCSQPTAVRALAVLVERGYLDRRDGLDGPQYRLCWTRRPDVDAPVHRVTTADARSSAA